MNLRFRVLRAVILAALLVVPTVAFAQVPGSMTQQGRLLNADGTPVATGAEVTFSVYDAATGGALIWEGTQNVDLDETGFYSTVLGDASNPLDASVFAGGAAYITLSVAGGAEMAPRHQLTSVPYAAIAGSIADGSITPAKLASGFVLDSTQVPAIDWSTVTGIPADIADGDADTLAGMTCTTGQVAAWDGSNWTCASVLTGNTATLSSLNCNNGQIAKMVGGAWACGADIDTDTTIADTNTTYTAGNQLTLNGTQFRVVEGPGSGLDADTLDGQQGSAYLRKTGGTMTGDLRVYGTKVTQSNLGAISTSYPTRSMNRLEVVNSRRRETVAIPHTQFRELCGDSDGCTYRIAMRYWGSNNDQAHASRGPYHFDYNSSTGRWRTAAGDVQGRDGDSAEAHVQNIWDCCYFSEHQYISAVAQNDSSRQMYLLNWSSGSCPLTTSLECTVIFDD